MKTYSGMISGEHKSVYVRYENGSKVLLSKHIKHGKDDKFDWTQNSDLSLNLALSILLDAFNNTECNTVKCKCSNQWVTEEVCKAFNEEFIVHLDKNYWKVNQYAVCDWVFDFIKNKESQKELVATS